MCAHTKTQKPTHWLAWYFISYSCYRRKKRPLSPFYPYTHTRRKYDPLSPVSHHFHDDDTTFLFNKNHMHDAVPSLNITWTWPWLEWSGDPYSTFGCTLLWSNLSAFLTQNLTNPALCDQMTQNYLYRSTLYVPSPICIYLCMRNIYLH